MPNVKIVRKGTISLLGYGGVHGVRGKFRDILYSLVSAVREGTDEFPFDIEITVTRRIGSSGSSKDDKI